MQIPERQRRAERRRAPGSSLAGTNARDRIIGTGVALPDDLGRIDLPHRPSLPCCAPRWRPMHPRWAPQYCRSASDCCLRVLRS